MIFLMILQLVRLMSYTAQLLLGQIPHGGRQEVGDEEGAGGEKRKGMSYSAEVAKVFTFCTWIWVLV